VLSLLLMHRASHQSTAPAARSSMVFLRTSSCKQLPFFRFRRRSAVLKGSYGSDPEIAVAFRIQEVREADGREHLRCWRLVVCCALFALRCVEFNELKTVSRQYVRNFPPKMPLPAKMQVEVLPANIFCASRQKY